MSEGLSTLDGDALVARVREVKERVLGPWVGGSAEKADTGAVLDECARRLAVAVVLKSEDRAQEAEAENGRLRGLIRAAITVRRRDPALDDECPICEPLMPPYSKGASEKGHAEGCPWPALVAEAAKP